MWRCPVAKIEREIVVSCSPDHVFDVVSNIERLPEFSEMTVAVKNGPGRAVRTGDRFEQVVKVADGQGRIEDDAETILANLKELCERTP
jgi:hypothetical protein